LTRILITGASGLLGINLALEIAKHHTVFGVVNRHSLKTSAFEVLKADLLRPGALENVLEVTRPDWVIHCAALANLEACKQDPVLAARLNTELPEKLATLVARSGARLIHVSTDAVFDGKRGDYSEDDAPNPINIYARTKLDGELAVRQANPQAIIARVNLFGWSLSGKRSLAEFFYYKLSAGERVNGFTDVFFCPLLVNHMAGVFLAMLEKGLSGLYHVVNRDCLTKYDFGLAIASKFRLDGALIKPVSVLASGLQAPRSPRLTLRVDKLEHDLGVVLPGIDSGIDEFYRLHTIAYPQRLFAMAAA